MCRLTLPTASQFQNEIISLIYRAHQLTYSNPHITYAYAYVTERVDPPQRHSHCAVVYNLTVVTNVPNFNVPTSMFQKSTLVEDLQVPPPPRPQSHPCITIGPVFQYGMLEKRTHQLVVEDVKNDVVFKVSRLIYTEKEPAHEMMPGGTHGRPRQARTFVCQEASIQFNSIQLSQFNRI